MTNRKRPRASKPKHAVEVYARAVVDKKIAAGRMVRLACQRHLDDLKHGAKRGLYFNPGTADHAIEFFSFLRLDGNENKVFVLLDWQVFIVGSIFGWLRIADDYRRFRTSYTETGKGSGKSPLAAGIGNYGLMSDNEWAAEIYCSAVTRDQAGIMFRDAKQHVENGPDLAPKLTIGQDNIAYEITNSFLRPVSSEARSLDGHRVHMALIDEIHEHRTPLVVEKMDEGKKARLQPLTFEITNAGYDRRSVCFDHHVYSLAVLENRIRDDTWFAYVCQLDPCAACRREGRIQPKDGCKGCDDWRNEKVWMKTNPSLPHGLPSKEYLREQVNGAVNRPAKQNIVKRLNFCIWTEQETRWLDLDLWDAGNQPIDVESLVHRPCFGGLDLSSNHDLTAFAKLFPPLAGESLWMLLLRFWIPEENVQERVQKDGIPYDQWIREGYMETTPGSTVDKDHIEEAIKEDAAVYKILQLGYDRFFADQMIQHLESQKPPYVPEAMVENPKTRQIERLKQWCIPVGMGHYSMAAPCKELELKIAAKTVRHGGNPVLRWNVGNAAVKLDPAGNMKPDKEKSTERIDGLVATLIAEFCALRMPQEKGSVYDERGPIQLGPG